MACEMVLELELKGASFSRSLMTSVSSPQGVDLMMYFWIFSCYSDMLINLNQIQSQPTHLYYSIFQMHANVWNLKSNKQRLQIMERTQAQKKHLINILAAKSQLDNHNRTKIKHCSSAPLNLLQRRIIQKDNQSMVCRIMRITQDKPSLTRTDSELSSVVRNLKTYSSLNRSIKMRQIQEENSKMFSRLIMTSPTISRNQWKKRNLQTSKYKENLHRGKYLKPDYSLEACKMLNREPKFRYINLDDSQKHTPLKKSKLL